jgi:hypothetical protein
MLWAIICVENRQSLLLALLEFGMTKGKFRNAVACLENLRLILTSVITGYFNCFLEISPALFVGLLLQRIVKSLFIL